MDVADKVLEDVRNRLKELRPLVEEHDLLKKVSDLLGPVKEPEQEAPKESLQQKASEAPLGLTAEGKPRKRRAPADPHYARKGWETRRRNLAEKRKSNVTRLHVTTQQPLTKDEARDVQNGSLAVGAQT